MITCKIKKITRGKKLIDVYDIVDVSNHNFVAENTVVHNCDESIRFACVIGNTLIKTPTGKILIKDLENKRNFKVYSFNEKTQKEEIQIAERCIKVKEDIVYEIETEDGKKIQATTDHKFLTKDGWKTLGNLKEGDDLVGI